MWSALKLSLSQMSQGARAAALAGVAAVAIIGLNAWRLANAPIGGAGPGSSHAEAPVDAQVNNSSKPNQTSAETAASNSSAPAKSDAAAKPDAAQMSASAPAAPAQTETAKPSFDIARVERDGSALVAGRAQPGSTVDLLDDGKVIGTIKTDDTGQFVMLPKALAPGSHLLSLNKKAPDGSVAASEQSITVIVPQTKQQEVIVALTAPGEATKLLSDAKPADAKPDATSPTHLSQAKPAFEGNVLIRTVEAGEGGALFATGSAPPGSEIQLYLSGTLIAKAIAAIDGHWSLKVEKGLKPGAYRVRADALSPKGEIMSRAEVPFDFPADVMASNPTSPHAAPAASTSSSMTTSSNVAATTTQTSAGVNAKLATPATQLTTAPQSDRPATASSAGTAQTGSAQPQASADAVVAQLDTAKVSRGDSLWRISRKIYGKGLRYTQIYEANTKQIRDPRLIYPGQLLVLPSDKAPN